MLNTSSIRATAPAGRPEATRPYAQRTCGKTGNAISIPRKENRRCAGSWRRNSSIRSFQSQYYTRQKRYSKSFRTEKRSQRHFSTGTAGNMRISPATASSSIRNVAYSVDEIMMATAPMLVPVVRLPLPFRNTGISWTLPNAKTQRDRGSQCIPRNFALNSPTQKRCSPFTRIVKPLS